MIPGSARIILWPAYTEEQPEPSAIHLYRRDEGQPACAGYELARALLAQLDAHNHPVHREPRYPGAQAHYTVANHLLRNTNHSGDIHALRDFCLAPPLHDLPDDYPLPEQWTYTAHVTADIENSHVTVEQDTGVIHDFCDLRAFLRYINHQAVGSPHLRLP